MAELISAQIIFLVAAFFVGIIMIFYFIAIILWIVILFALRLILNPISAAILIVVILLAVLAHAEDAKPRQWCGWFARHELVQTDPGPEFNRACKWLKWGRPTQAQVGAIVIWCRRNGRGHVGKITGMDANGNFIIKSGNDGRAVRERVRSVAGAQFRIGDWGLAQWTPGAVQ